jgi:hypothetical protein
MNHNIITIVDIHDHFIRRKTATPGGHSPKPIYIAQDDMLVMERTNKAEAETGLQ